MLRTNPHGIVLAEHQRTGTLRRRIPHKDGRVHLDPPEIVAEIERLAAAPEPPPEYPLRLIGLRELRSHGTVENPVIVTDEMSPGTVAVPHGWGHEGGGWKCANAAGGVNVNVLASPSPTTSNHWRAWRTSTASRSP